MLITTILQFVRRIQSFAILSILARLVMLKSSSFLAIPHSTSDFSVYAVDTYPFLVDYLSVLCCGFSILSCGLSSSHPNCGIETLGGVEEATKGKKAPTTADDSDDDAVIERFKSDEEPEFVSF